MHKHEAILDWQGKQLSFVIDDARHDTPITCTSRHSETKTLLPEIIEETKEISDNEEDEYKEEDLVEQPLLLVKENEDGLDLLHIEIKD